MERLLISVSDVFLGGQVSRVNSIVVFGLQEFREA